MKISNLKRAHDLEVQKWMEDNLNLNPYQKEKLRNDEIVRFAPYYFYKIEKSKTSFIWRLTLPLFVPYWIILFIGLPFNFLITGKWGYGRGFIDKFHSKWVRKLGL
jgi:hypothetical protein